MGPFATAVTQAESDGGFWAARYYLGRDGEFDVRRLPTWMYSLNTALGTEWRDLQRWVLRHRRWIDFAEGHRIGENR